MDSLLNIIKEYVFCVVCCQVLWEPLDIRHKDCPTKSGIYQQSCRVHQLLRKFEQKLPLMAARR